MRSYVQAFPLLSVISAFSLGTYAVAVESAQVLEQFSVARDGDALLVPLTIGGREYIFMVDTGAAITLFDTRLKPELGEPLSSAGGTSTPLGSTATTLHEPPIMQLGRMFVTPTNHVACMPLDDMRKATGHNIDGLLGMDVLSRLVVHLDFDKGTLSILQFAPPSNNAIPLTRLRPPSISVTFPHGADLPFVIDTGDISRRSGSMQSTLFSRLVETADLSLLGATNVTDASATAAARQGTVSACGAFGLRLTDTVWGEHTGNTGNHVSLYFLTQFTVTFDFPNRRVLLEKNTNFGHADMVDLSGLHFRRVDGNIVIESVDGGSPADKAGIRAGDRIKSVNSQDSTRARLFALRESLSQPGERVDVVLQRGKDIVRRQFELPNRLATRADRSRKATHRFASRPASN